MCRAEMDLEGSSMKMRIFRSKLGLAAAVALVGCAGRPALIPNKDSSLRKTSTEFAADAAKRTYEADAPRGGEAAARAETDYTLKEIRLANLSPEDWSNVEVWVNQKYVVSLASLPHQDKSAGYRHLNFQMLYDNQGQYFPVSFLNSKVRVEKVEIFRDGKMFDVPVKLAD